MLQAKKNGMLKMNIMIKICEVCLQIENSKIEKIQKVSC